MLMPDTQPIQSSEFWPTSERFLGMLEFEAVYQTSVGKC